MRTAPRQNLGAVLLFEQSADGGTRTRTILSNQRILSPLRLPFRHIGLSKQARNQAALGGSASSKWEEL
jgi:hypothetical protein